MSGFVKLDCDILDSSMMLEDSDTFKAFIIFLASCNSEGIADVPAASIVMRCKVSPSRAMEILKILSSPDVLSKSKEEGGRRIIPYGDSGHHWKVVNYKKYRDFNYSNTPEAIRKRRQRGNGEFMVTGETDISLKTDSFLEGGHVTESVTLPGHVTTPLSSVLLSSNSSYDLKENKETIKEVTIVPSPVDELFKYWLSHKNMVQHKELSDKVKAKIKATFKEESFENLKAAIDNYSSVLATPGYFYTYRHSMEDFFRAGANKISPYKRFLPEMNPLENLKKKQNFSSGYTQQAQETPEVDSRVEQERFTEDRALNRLSEAVRKFKSARGEDPKKWVEFFRSARPVDRDNSFLKWIWDMAINGIPFTEEIFNQIHNRIVAESGLTYDTFEQARDEIFKRGFTAPSAQQRA